MYLINPTVPLCYCYLGLIVGRAAAPTLPSAILVAPPSCSISWHDSAAKAPKVSLAYTVSFLAYGDYNFNFL